ncbi:unnamed protein product [Effrenium voratum]|uniref:Kinesin-like protein n=1 Tax=Effrenium voratum TaxID=2562239 RepID=A0AA36J3J7_9DINO|nr:unnamed protein product [Effrenium voratum]CAJ1455563.1 unnamed protein product [Effrenium voratum]
MEANRADDMSWCKFQPGERRSTCLDSEPTSISRAFSACDLGARPAPRAVAEPRAAGVEELEWEEIRQRSPQECIRVAARFRPDTMDCGNEKNCIKFGQDGQTCTLRIKKNHGLCDCTFAYDHMFQPEASQSDVYCTIAKPIVEGVINGFNGAILAYGQTGSGKTHTMFGPHGAQAFVEDGEMDFESLGIIPRALQELVDYAKTTQGLVQLRASYVETYNENVIDLLSPMKGGALVGDQSLQSAAMREQGQVLYLPTVTETPVSSVREALEVMRTGNRNRHQAETKMNRHSSRSHAVFIVTVTNRVDPARQRFAQLYLVDLAGSERVMKTGVQGMQLEEAKNINKSLLALGQVIWALAHKQKHIPYRDSKLTQLLRNCLGGNARTAVMITASSHSDNAGESLSALRFGARASLVENSARENIAENAHELKRLLEQARQDLAELRGCCRQLQAELTAYKSAEAAPVAVAQPGSMQSGLAKRLVVWGLLPSLVCPINRAIMRDPVLAADGWTYERRAVEKHMARAGRTMPKSPVTGERFSTRQVLPNMVVRQLVSQYLPELGPLDEPLPHMQLLHVWHVQLILSFLDAKSLARCETAWPSFLAAADAGQTWSHLLLLDFGFQPEEKWRESYRELAFASSKQSVEGRQRQSTYGLKLYKCL